MVMRSKQGSTHLTFPDVSVVPRNVGIEVVTADTTVELGEFVSKHMSPWLLLPVTVMSGLVLASPSPKYSGSRLLAGREKYSCVFSNMHVPDRLFDVGPSREKRLDTGDKSSDIGWFPILCRMIRSEARIDTGWLG